jgi:alpha-L-fucosidase 2
MGWKTNLWARLLDGDHAYLILGNLLNPVFNQSTGMKGGGMYENLFCAHPPFQIDGNFGGAAGVAEMLLQSHVPAGNNEATPRFIIHLLPALPKAWPTGSIKGIRARGGITVDFSWKDGMLSSATLTPMADGPISIRFGEKTVELPAKAGSPLKITGDLKPAVEQ